MYNISRFLSSTASRYRSAEIAVKKNCARIRLLPTVSVNLIGTSKGNAQDNGWYVPAVTVASEVCKTTKLGNYTDDAKIYSDKINSNQRWQWDGDILGGENLTRAQKAKIKELAVANGNLPNIKINKVGGKSFADFKSAGPVKEIFVLPNDKWLLSDTKQFKWLDEQIGSHVDGYTWHHSEVSGEMELVQFGIHNITNHNGGRTVGRFPKIGGITMNVKSETIINPLPTDEYILKKEKGWRVKLLVAYKNFIKNYNGGMPEETSFICNKHEYVIDRFLCILSDYRTHKLGAYDVGVVLTQIRDRLSDNPDLIGVELLPISILFAGDFLCLDFRKSKENPCICVWSHEESEEDMPITYFVSNSFEEFIQMLTK